MAVTDHKNYHSKIETYYNVINVLVMGNDFQKQSGCEKIKRKSIDLFSTGNAKFSLGLIIQNYKDQL